MFMTTDASMAPNTRVPEEFFVRLKPNRGYSKSALLANVAKKGGKFEPEFEIEDKRGKPRPIIPLV